MARHILFSRLFGEFAGTLETYAAWAWALRHRFEQGSFLDAYLGYSNQDIGNFYALVAGHDAGVSDLLRLPPVERIVEITMARNASLPAAGYRESLRAQYERLRVAADMYFQNDRVIIDAYNKTKHGTPMVRLFEPDNPQRFEMVLRNPARAQPGEPPYRFASFAVDAESIDRQRNNVKMMTESIADLAGVTKILLEADALYAEPDDALAH
jgi:hypothetical protein